MDDLLENDPDQNHLEMLIENCPIAMNSIVFDLAEVKKLVKEYKNSLFLSKQYRIMETTQTYFNFEIDKPLIQEKVYAF